MNLNAKCNFCGFPTLMCLCKTKEKTKIKVYIESRKYRKPVTIIAGLINPKENIKTLKNLCASGGTLKDGKIELQGNHKEKVEAYIKKHALK